MKKRKRPQAKAQSLVSLRILCGENHNGDVAGFSDVLHDLYATDFWDHKVQEDKLYGNPVEFPARLLAVIGTDYLKIFCCQITLQHFTDFFVILYQEDCLVIHFELAPLAVLFVP